MGHIVSVWCKRSGERRRFGQGTDASVCAFLRIESETQHSSQFQCSDTITEATQNLRDSLCFSLFSEFDTKLYVAFLLLCYHDLQMKERRTVCAFWSMGDIHFHVC